ncbi:hypothetical protein [Deinococcus humi]|uniref:Uncharacterized protein n=1 Tax=Deinococcus humi TaxID=662880 RepID=A0A7W8ND83_9DEIO|nr:hypothetical protein [Deinococcus humi]MBB5361365.1 hypothetical protein [Deinococcus humi]GGO19705.1 hypothetical protein GCM10008949_04270 [Deinococcus humi]
MPQTSPHGAAPQPAPLSFLLTDSATGDAFPLHSSSQADLIEQLESIHLFGGISHTTACALAHAGYERGHGEYLAWGIVRGEG